MSNDRTPTDLPELPEGWVETDVGSLMSLIQYGHTAAASARATGPRFLRITDIQDGRVDWDTVPSCDMTVEEQEKYRLRPGDLVFARTGATTGKSYLIRTPPDAVFASYLIRLRTTQGIDPAFVYWFFQSASYWSQISKGKRGVGQPNVNATILASLQAPVAPSSEQHRIVAELDELFYEFDAGVAALERAQAKLKRYRASVLKAAVEGKLTEEWRRKNPPDERGEELLRRILVERRNRWEEEQLAKFNAKGQKPPKNWQQKYKEPVEPNTSELPELPEGWCWATVDQITAGNRTSAYGVLKPGPEIPGGIPLVRVGNIRNGVVSGQLKRIAPEVASRYGRTRLRGGELLITLVGAIGRTAVVPSELSGVNTARAVGVVPISSMLDPRWIELWFRSPLERHRMIGKAHEVARKTLNLEDVRNATVALPPASELDAILLAVEQTERGLTPTVEHMKESVSFSGALRQSILKRAFEGRLVRQDPDDEPASVLVERIRAEREAARKQREHRPTRPKRQHKSQIP